MKEYLRAATRIAKEINKSCQRTWTLAHVKRPVNPSARTLSGSGSKRVLQLKLKKGFRCCPLESDDDGCSCSFDFPCSFTSLLLLLFAANNGRGCDFWEIVKGLGLKESELGKGKECGGGGRWEEIENEGFKFVNPTTMVVMVIAILFFFTLEILKGREERTGIYKTTKIRIFIVFFYSKYLYLCI